MQSFSVVRQEDTSETPAIFFKPLGLSKRFMFAQGKSKLDDGAKLHPFLRKDGHHQALLQRKRSLN